MRLVRWTAVACLAPLAAAQICNSEDPDSGGLLIPAFSGTTSAGADGEFPETDHAELVVVGTPPTTRTRRVFAHGQPRGMKPWLCSAMARS